MQQQMERKCVVFLFSTCNQPADQTTSVQARAKQPSISAGYASFSPEVNEEDGDTELTG